MSTEKYKPVVDAHRRNVKFNEDNYVIVYIHPKYYLKHLSKKLHAQASGPFRILRKFGSNTYYLGLSFD